MEDNKSRVGFTKTGFSKSGFVACSHYKNCEMGRLFCYYKDIDPEVELHCYCFQRHHSNMLVKKSIEEQTLTFDLEDEIETVEIEEQLSLF